MLLTMDRKKLNLCWTLIGCCRTVSAKRSKNCLQLRVRSCQMMSKPDSKFPKMSEPGDIKRKHVQLFDPEATAFEQLVKMEAFVDHSNVIKRILQQPKQKYVAAPSRFCKSANMAMARSFLEIEVHKDGENKGEAVRDVMREATSVEELKGTNLKNYDLFCVPEPKCKILEDEEFVLKHFGRYPVIALDFAVEEITSYSEAVDHCLKVIHKAYVQHEYLQKSTRLDPKDANGNKDAQDVYKAWCDDQKYKEGNEGNKMQKIRTGLGNLTKYLYYHFGRKIVLLVDDFDAILSRAKFRVETDKELSRISSLVVEMFLRNLKSDQSAQFVENVLLTGVETMTGLSPSRNLAGLTRYMFLDKQEFVGFYGIQENDVRGLVTKLKSKRLLPLFEDKEVQQIMEEIMKQFDGYYSLDGQSVPILSLWSVLHYLQDGKAQVNWTKSQVMTHITPFLKCPFFTGQILQFVGKPAGDETVYVKFPGIIDIPQMRRLGQHYAKHRPFLSDILFYLKELGYLSNVKESSDGKLKLASEDIRRELFELLVEPDVKVLGINLTIMQQMENVLDDIFSPHNISEETCHKHLRKIFDTLKTLFTQGFARFKRLDLNESVFLLLMVIALSKVRSLQWISPDHADSKGTYLTPETSIWIQHKKTNSVLIFQLKYNTLGYSSPTEEQKQTSLYALKEILGKEEGKKGYVSALNTLKPLKYLLIGLSMDLNYQPSISCLLSTGDDKKTICLSETELAKFPAYYEGCVDLLKKQKEVE